MTASAAAPYETLCELAERELELAAEGSFEPIAELQTIREELIATLPATPPPEARAALQRCALLERRAAIEILRSREALLLALAGVAQGQRAASGYAPPGLHAPRVSASA